MSPVRHPVIWVQNSIVTMCGHGSDSHFGQFFSSHHVWWHTSLCPCLKEKLNWLTNVHHSLTKLHPRHLRPLSCWNLYSGEDHKFVQVIIYQEKVCLLCFCDLCSRVVCRQFDCGGEGLGKVSYIHGNVTHCQRGNTLKSVKVCARVVFFVLLSDGWDVTMHVRCMSWNCEGELIISVAEKAKM